MNNKIILGIVMFLLSAVLISAAPPILTNFHQFYGTINNLSEGTYSLKAFLSDENVVITAIAADGKYGYSSAFKIFGEEGQNISFLVKNNLGAETLAGWYIYQNKGLTELNLFFPRAAVAVAGTCDESSWETNAWSNCTLNAGKECQGTQNRTVNKKMGVNCTGDGGKPVLVQSCTPACSTGKSCNNNGMCVVEDSGRSTYEQRRKTVASENVSGLCTQNWQCGLWSTCSNSLQTRSCVRIDNCDSLQAKGKVTQLITSLKPAEQRSCESVSASPINNNVPENVCSPHSKRCLSDELQRCSADGTRWISQEICAQGCDSVLLKCLTTVPSASLISSLPLIAYIVAGVLAAGSIAGLIFFVFRNKKYGPVKEYISEARMKGYSDTQIKARLLNEGWDEDKVDKLLI